MEYESPKLERSGLPSTLERLLRGYRFRKNRIAIGYIAGAVGFLLMVFMLRDVTGSFVWVLAAFAVVLYFIGMQKYITRTKMLGNLEEAARQYGLIDKVLLDVERDLKAPAIQFTKGIICEHWILTDDLEWDLILFPVEPITEVDIDPAPLLARYPQTSKLYVHFESGRIAFLSESEREMCETYARLVHRFGPLPTTDRAWQILINYTC